MRKIIKWLKADPKRMAGILLALLAVLVVVFFVRSLLAPKVQEQKVNQQGNLTETERNLLIEDLNLNGNDAEDVDPDVAKRIMHLEVVVSDEI